MRQHIEWKKKGSGSKDKWRYLDLQFLLYLFTVLIPGSNFLQHLTTIGFNSFSICDMKFLQRWTTTKKSHDRKNKYLTRLFFSKYLGFHFRFLVKHFPFIKMNFTSAFALACISDRRHFPTKKKKNIFPYKALSKGNHRGRHSLDVHKFTLFTGGCSNWNGV